MRKLSFILLLSFLSVILSAQDLKTEEKTITGTFNATDKNKSELFSSINKWISINYNSAKNVIQMNDLESGTIIVKGINVVQYKNTAKQLYPNNKYIPETTTLNFNHLIEINIKDNKYRIIYKITGLDYEGYDNLFFNCINLDTLDNNAIHLYNQSIEEPLKKALMGKEKREKVLALSKPMFIEINAILRDNIILTILSIGKSVSEKNDNW
jgi:Domain of unknown function (DUF4468) with TBP-like fold